MIPPTVDVIIVNYNTRDRTLECLESVFAQQIEGLSVIVVDNGSVDGSTDAIASAHPSATVIDIGENVGFARGVNRGVEASRAEFVLLLNPDATVLPGSLESLIEFAVQHPAHGVYGGRTIRPDGVLDPSSCWGAPSLWSLLCFATGLSTAFRRSRILDPESLGAWQRDSVREVPIVTGCLLLVRRCDWDRVGAMDERFFLYGEDAEFSARAVRRGFRPVIVPGAQIVHDVGGSTGSSGRKMAMVMAGKVTYLWSVWPAPHALAGVLLLQAGAGVRSWLETLSKARRETWRDVWRHRRAWRRGYPAAERTLFGRTPSQDVKRPLVVQAEPAFRTDAANPYNGSLYRAIERKGALVRDLNYWRLLTERTDVIHLHWPDLSFLSGPRRLIHVTRLSLFYGSLAAIRRRGTILVWTVHNVTSHEQRSSPRLRDAAHRLLVENLDGIIGLTEQGLDAAREEYSSLSEIPSAVTPHGHYRDAYDLGRSREAARIELGIDSKATVIVTVGQIRRYKNVPHLIETFSKLDGELMLIVAGKAAPAELEQEIRFAASVDPRVRLELRFMSDSDIATILAAADLVVLPYSRIQNSGSAILAVSADRPVLVPDLGGLRELRDQVGSSWVRLFDGELGVADLREALAWATADERSDVADLSALEWDSIADRTIAAYRGFQASSLRRNDGRLR